MGDISEGSDISFDKSYNWKNPKRYIYYEDINSELYESMNLRISKHP